MIFTRPQLERFAGDPGDVLRRADEPSGHRPCSPTGEVAPSMNATETHDRIDEHTRQAWALSEFLLTHFNDGDEGRDIMSDEVMSGLMENLTSHLREIRELIKGQEVDHAA